MRIAKYLFTIFYTLYALLFSFIYLWGIGSGEQSFFAVLALGIVSITLLFIFQRKISDLSDDTLAKLPRYLKFAGILLFLLQVLFAAAFQTENIWGWDFDTIVYLAKSLLNGNDTVNYTYLAKYENNLLYFGVVVLLFALTKLLSGSIWTFSLIILNILVLDGSLFGVYKLVELLKGKRQAYFVLLLCLFFTPYWFYLPIAYTDILSMPFFVFPVLLTVYYEKKGQSTILLLGSGVLGAVGYYFKGTPIVTVVAILIYMLLRSKAYFGKRAVLSLIGGFLGTFLLTGWLLNMSLHALVTEDTDAYKIPIEYWIYTGLVEDGTWNVEVVALTNSYDSYEEKQDGLRKAIAEQLREYGVFGVIGHIAQKKSVMWSQGTLSAEVFVQREPVHDRFVERMIGEKSFTGLLYCCYSQGYWRAVLLFFTIGLWRRVRVREREEAWELLLLTSFGVLLFFSFWESSARYLVNNVWIILVVAAESLYALGERMKGDGSI